MPKKMQITKVASAGPAPGVTPVPEVMMRYVRRTLPGGGLEFLPTKVEVLGDEVGTREAGKILGLSRRRVTALCDEGVFVEGADWRQNPSATGRGCIRIKLEAVLRLKRGHE